MKSLQHTGNRRSGSGQPAANGDSKILPKRKRTGPRTPDGKQRSKLNALKHGIFSDIVLLKGESRVKYNLLWNGLRKAFRPAGEPEEVCVEDMAINRWRLRRLIQAEVAEIRKATDFMWWEQETREQKEFREIDCSSVLSDQGGLISRIDNPYVLEGCLDLLAELREKVAQAGLTKGDTVILQRLYGRPDSSNLGDRLINEYMCWWQVAEVSEGDDEERRNSILEEIDAEIQRLENHQKARGAIESERMKVEAARRVVPESPALDRLLRYEVNLQRSFDRALGQLERLQWIRLGQPVLPKLEVRHSLS